VSGADAEYEATKRRKQPTLAEALADVQAAISPSAERAAEMLNSLGTALKRERLGNNRPQQVVDAVAKLTGLLLEGSNSSSSSGGGSRIEQLGGKQLAQSAWALSQVKSVRGTDVMQLGLAIADQALHGEAMKAEGWRSWSGVLYGLARAGISCRNSKQVQQLFAHAVTQRLPQLFAQKQGCTAQDVSNTFHATVTAGYSGSLEPLVSAVTGELSWVMEGATAQAWANVIWACAKQGESVSGRLGQSMPVLLREGAAAMACLAKSSSVVPQDVSNALWAFASFSWYDADIVSELAAAMAKQATYSKPQDLSNAIWALSKLGWYDAIAIRELTAAMAKQATYSNPQDLSNALWALSKLGWYDTSVYSTLTSAFVQKSSSADPQHFSNVLLSCAEARHWDSSMEELAEFVSKQSNQQWGKWKEQELSNSLYAWAVLTAAGPPAASASPSFKVMAQQLLGHVSKRCPSAFKDSEMSQLYLAHQVAVHGKLPGGGLSANAKLLDKADAAYGNVLSALRTAVKYNKGAVGAVEQQVVEALQRVGYEVEVAPVVEKGGLKEMAPLFDKGVAVRVGDIDEYFRSPPDLLSGGKQIHNVLAGWVCGSSIVILMADWAGLKGDPQQQQQTYVAQRMQEALA